jgi:hypothetical protein
MHTNHVYTIFIYVHYTVDVTANFLTQNKLVMFDRRRQFMAKQVTSSLILHNKHNIKLIFKSFCEKLSFLLITLRTVFILYFLIRYNYR